MKLINTVLTIIHMAVLAAGMSSHEKRWIVYLTGYGG
jgi:hypothetical protein